MRDGHLYVSRLSIYYPFGIMLPMQMKITSRERLDSLADLAENQAGFFSASQATKRGVSHTHLAKLTRAGHLIREHWGVYRFARWPTSEHADLWRTLLWSQAKRGPVQAAFSHRTALQLHDISDINPDKIELMLPITMRRLRRQAPPAVRLHFAPLYDSEVVPIDGLPVTAIYRTLTDLILEGISRDAVLVAIENASKRKLIGPKELEKLRSLYSLDRATVDYLISTREATEIRGH